MGDDFTVSKKLVFINTLSSLVVRVISIAVLIWVQQFLLKYISVEEYSILPVVMSLLVFFPLMTAVFTTGIKRYVLVSFVEKNNVKLSEVVSSIFPVLCLVSLFLFVLGYFFSINIHYIINVDEKYIEHAQFMFMLLIFSEAFRLPFEAFSSGLYVKQKFVLSNIIMIVSELVRFSLLFIILFGFYISIKAVVISTVVGNILQSLLILFFSLRLLPQQKFSFSRINLSTIKELSNFGGWSSIHGVAGMIRKTSDAFILNRLSTPLDVTSFHLGSLIPNRLEVIINQSFLGSVSPAIVGLNAQKQFEKLKFSYLRIGRYSLWGILFFLPVFIVFHKPIVINYVGDEFLSAGMVLVLLLMCFPIYYGNILYKTLADAKNRMRSLAIREVISTVLNVSLTIFLVSYYNLGAIGSALATFIVFGLGGFFIYWPLGRELSGATWSEVWRDILFPGVTPFVMTVLFLLTVSQVFDVKSWVDIFFAGASGVIVYLPLVWFLANDSDRSVIRSVVLKILRK